MVLIEIAKYLVSKGYAAVFLNPPATPTVTPQGAAGATTYGYAIVANNDVGSTTANAAGTTATGNAALSVANYNAIAWGQQPGATGYDIYRVQGGATQGKIGHVDGNTFTFNDTGLAGDATTPPGANTAATDIGIGSLPKTPDRCFAVLAYGSAQANDSQFGTSLLFREYPVVRILRRGAIGDTIDAMTQANSAYIDVGKIGVDTLSGVLYESTKVFPPSPTGPDGSNRPIWEFRARFCKAPSLS